MFLRCDEHYLLHKMRNCDAFIRELDFVAEIDGKIVANIVYAKSKIIGDNGGHYNVITFGPISVLPEYQGKGIGSMLIKYTIGIAKELGYRAILNYIQAHYRVAQDVFLKTQYMKLTKNPQESLILPSLKRIK